MPVNMDPVKKRRRAGAIAEPVSGKAQEADKVAPPRIFGEETQEDREKDLADAERNNLWDATEVIDMDKV